MYNSLLNILKIFAPITPFITEEIYQNYFKKNAKEKSIHASKWPDALNIKDKKKNDLIWEKFTEILDKVRKAKSENKKSMKAEIVLSIDKKEKELLSGCLSDLKAVCCAKEVKEGSLNVVFI